MKIKEEHLYVFVNSSAHLCSRAPAFFTLYWFAYFSADIQHLPGFHFDINILALHMTLSQIQTHFSRADSFLSRKDSSQGWRNFEDVKHQDQYNERGNKPMNIKTKKMWNKLESAIGHDAIIPTSDQVTIRTKGTKNSTATFPLHPERMLRLQIVEAFTR